MTSRSQDLLEMEILTQSTLVEYDNDSLIFYLHPQDSC